MMAGVRWLTIVTLVSACAPLPPPRAIVAVHAPDDAARAAILVTPTTCVATDPLWCQPVMYLREHAAHGPDPGLDEIVDPLVRLKLELAGYTLADARSLRLTTVDRVDTSVQNDARGQTSAVATTTKVEDGATVASLSSSDQAAAARSLGLTGALVSTLHITRERPSMAAQIRVELVVELYAIPEGTPLWTVRCSEPIDDLASTARLLASCVGDGVLAWRAPDAVIARQP
jgi:hypothetical protein